MATTNLITLTEPRSPAAEAYRTLRANLMHLSAAKPLATFLVTSAASADDKSLAVANLAAAFALAGHKTILVDADLRRPAQHEIWGIQPGRGLADMITDDKLMADPPLLKTSIENLLLLSGGTTTGSPSDLFANPRLNDIIGVLKARAHFVIFEVPPVLAVSDAAALGTILDGAVLVVKAGSTRRDHVARAREALERVHVNVLGAALVNAPRDRTNNY